jgi:uncharacterized membrane protein YhaH (DUF805 family)
MQSLLFSFNGRINRAKFWLVHIAANIVWIILMGILVAVTGGSLTPDAKGNMPDIGGGPIGAVIAFVLLIALLWISLAIGVKRWHDRNKSGWWVLIAFVPVIGGLWYLIECGFLKGTSGPNTYGPDPLAAG